MTKFRDRYGAGPLHLLATVAMLAFCGYVLVQVFDGLYPWNLLLWFAGAIVAHDLIAFPLYSLLDRIAYGRIERASSRLGREPINFLRIPALVSGMLLVIWFPEILGLSEQRYEAATGQSEDVFLGRWLAITAVLFLVSGLLMAFRLRSNRQGSGNI